MMLSAGLIEALTAQGSHDQAMDVLESTGYAGAPPPASIDGVALLYARGLLRAAVDRCAEAARDLLEAGDRLAAWRIRNPAVLPWRSAAASALHRIGDGAAARRLAATEVEVARGWGADGPLGRALRTYGRLLQGPRQLAVLAEATRVLQGSGWDLEFASSLVDRGDALRRNGFDVEARRHLKKAYEIALRLGATAVADEARNAHRAAGGRMRTGRRPASLLSTAELRVAALAAENRTNREIAAALFITQRTVEIHLSRSYRKLGISSRAELGGALRETTAAPGVDPAEGAGRPVRRPVLRPR